MNILSRFSSPGAMLLAAAIGLTSSFVPARAQTPGSVDTTFNVGYGATGSHVEINGLAIQADDKIILTGLFADFNHVSDRDVVRLNTDGSVDTTFNTGTGPNNGGLIVALQNNGEVVLGGTFTTFDGVARQSVVELTTAGAVDPTFTPGTGTSADNPVTVLATQSDGKVLVGGQFTTFSGVAANHLVRLDANGSVDPTFTAALAAGDIVYPQEGNLLVQSDGKIFVRGTFSSAGGGSGEDILIRLNTDGDRDAAFQAIPFLFDGYEVISAMALQSDGKVVVAFQEVDNPDGTTGNLYRFNADGTQDTTFHSLTGTSNLIDTMAVQSDDKIVIGGGFSTVDGVPLADIARLNADGTVDTAFNPGSGSAFGVDLLALQSNGEIIAQGGFGTFDGVAEMGVVRLHGGDLVPSTVNLAVGGSGIAEKGGEKGIVRVIRTGDTSSPLTVLYKTKGTAKAGVDYKALPGTVTIPAGAVQAKLKIKPIDGSPDDGTLKVKVVLLPPTDDSYEVGASKVKIKLVE